MTLGHWEILDIGHWTVDTGEVRDAVQGTRVSQEQSGGSEGWTMHGCCCRVRTMKLVRL